SSRFLLITIIGLVGILLLIAILLFRYVSLHNAFLDTNAEILDEVDNLQETSDQLQETVDTLIASASSETIPADDLVEVNQVLDQLGEDIVAIEDVIEESSLDVVAEVPDEQVENSAVLSDEEGVEELQND